MDRQFHPKKVAIVGAGPAGLTAAYALAKKGVSVEIFEAGSAVGGMAKTIRLWGQLVDLGPHRFFSKDPRVNGLWIEVVGRDYEIVRRLTRIYYKNTFFDYPLRPFNVLEGLGVVEAARCILSYVAIKISPPSDTTTFQGWVTSRFGTRLFEIFFKSYSEKLWGLSCDRLDADFAAQRINKFSLAEAMRSAVTRRGAAKHKTLIDEFAYPKQGTGVLYERMARKIEQAGGIVRLNTAVSSVRPAQGDRRDPVLVLSDGSGHYFDHVISTMPLTHLVERMDAPWDVRHHSKALKFRNTILVYLLVAGSELFPDQWIYVHSEKLKVGRITNFSNWVPSIRQGETDTILCLEYWCYNEDPQWTTEDAELIRLAKRELSMTGLTGVHDIREGKVVRIPRCYPVYATGYKAHLEPIREFLSCQPGISVIGRYGAFKYNNQDHSILMGLLAAENILADTNHDLWGINSDYEYQESGEVSQSELFNNR